MPRRSQVPCPNAPSCHENTPDDRQSRANNVLRRFVARRPSDIVATFDETPVSRRVVTV